MSEAKRRERAALAQALEGRRKDSFVNEQNRPQTHARLGLR